MPETSTRKLLIINHEQTIELLEEMERKCFNEWSQSLDGQYNIRLEQPLLKRYKSNLAKLDINFDEWV